MDMPSATFLASAYEGGWPVLSLTVLSPHQQCSVHSLQLSFLWGADGAQTPNQFQPQH